MVALLAEWGEVGILVVTWPRASLVELSLSARLVLTCLSGLHAISALSFGYTIRIIIPDKARDYAYNLAVSSVAFKPTPQLG